MAPDPEEMRSNNHIQFSLYSQQILLARNFVYKSFILPDIPISESDTVKISGSTEDEGRIDIGFWPLPIASCSLSSRLLLFSSEPTPLSK